MAKRAAMVEAYRKMVEALAGAGEGVAGGTGTITVSGYLKGCRLKETRYYANGDVEVDLEIDCPGAAAARAETRERRADDRGSVAVERGARVISEEEWRALFSGAPPVR